MQLIYCILIRFYYITIILVSPFNVKAKAWIKGRKGLFEKLRNAIDEQSNIIWFHCASLGEFEQGRPVIEAYKKQNPDHKILLTFFSPSGYEIRKNYTGVDWVFYLPIDTKSNAKEFLSIVKPMYNDSLKNIRKITSLSYEKEIEKIFTLLDVETIEKLFFNSA